MFVDCLIDYIGVRGCGNTPPSRLFVDELPGIDLNAIDSLATLEQSNFIGVWDDVQKRASRKFMQDFRAELKTRYRLNTPQDQIAIPTNIDNTSPTTAAAEYRGILIELDKVKDSDFLSIEIDTPKVWLPSAESITLKVFDADTKEELDSVTISGAPGFNTIVIDGQYRADSLFVAYDASLIDSAKIDLSDLDNHHHCQCFNNTFFFLFDDLNCRMSLSGASSDLDLTTITSGLDSFGLTAKVSVRCSVDNYVCCNLSEIQTAFWYLCGIELMNERIYSTKITNYTLFDAEKAKELKRDFLANYRGGTDSLGAEHGGYLPLAIDGLLIDEHDCCIECSSPARTVSARL